MGTQPFLKSAFNSVSETVFGPKSDPVPIMKSKHERQLAKSIANTSFVEVAKLPFVQNKWISTRVWFELYKQKVNMNTELIDHSYFKRTLVATDSFVRNDLSIASECGYYWQASKISIGRGNR